ncbi:MAG: hypothetical protein V1809_06810 [Planctomycetota bacterium]
MLLLILFLLSLMVLATRIASLLHEGLGHALPVVLLGGAVRSVELSLFGGGWVNYTRPPGGGAAGAFLVAYGGILVNLALGFLCLALVRRVAKTTFVSSLLIMSGMVNVLGALAYLILGLYYDWGDPAGGAAGRAWWAPLLVLSPAAAWLAARPYAVLQESIFPRSTAPGRVVVAMRTLGVAGALYTGLFFVTEGRLVSAEAPRAARERSVEEARQRKIEAVAAGIRRAHPDFPEDRVRREAATTPVVVRPEEVPSRFPLIPVLALLLAAGGVAALATVKPGESVPAASPLRFPSRRTVALATGLAALVLGGIYLGTSH